MTGSNAANFFTTKRHDKTRKNYKVVALTDEIACEIPAGWLLRPINSFKIFVFFR